MKTILVDAVYTFVLPGEGIFVAMQQLLDRYPNTKIILTNANDEQLVAFGLHDLPYKLFTLKHNPDKVDPHYFTRMLAHYHLTPAEVIYFEHDARAVDSARSVGIVTYHYDAATRDLTALRAFLDEQLS